MRTHYNGTDGWHKNRLNITRHGIPTATELHNKVDTLLANQMQTTIDNASWWAYERRIHKLLAQLREFY